MHIEIIGSTSAGKTTLARKMVFSGMNKGEFVSLSDDFVLEKSHLGWVRNDFLQRRIVEIIALVICLNHLNEYKDFLRFVFHEGKSSPGSWIYKVNRMRNVIRKIGVFEFISKRAAYGQVVLADNEGLLQGVHNLFVHQNGGSDLTKISRYVDLVPLPDVVLYLQQDEDVLVSRTLERGHARIKADAPENVVNFIHQAVKVFNELAQIPKVQERLIIVDDGMNFTSQDEGAITNEFNRVVNLVHS